MRRLAWTLTILIALVFGAPLAAPQDTAIGQFIATQAHACSGPSCPPWLRTRRAYHPRHYAPRPQVYYRQPVVQQRQYAQRSGCYSCKPLLRKKVVKTAKCCAQPTTKQVATSNANNKVHGVKTIAKGDNASATTTITQSNTQHTYNFHGVGARPLRGGGVATNLRGRAEGGADFKRSDIDITTVTCTMSSGKPGVVAKVKSTGRSFCVVQKVATN